MNEAALKLFSTEAQLQRQVDGLANLLVFSARLRTVKTQQELGFVLVNDFRMFTSFSDAYFLYKKSTQDKYPVLLNSNDTFELEKSSELSQWVSGISRHLVQKTQQDLYDQTQIPEKCSVYTANSLIDACKRDGKVSKRLKKLCQQWPELEPDTLLWLPVFSDQTDKAPAKVMGGLMIFRKARPQESEIAAMSEAITIASHEAHFLSTKKSIINSSINAFISSKKARLGLVLAPITLALVFITVPLSVLAPASVISQQAQVARASLSGAIQSIVVAPNTTVKKGQTLIVLDDKELQTKKQVAQQSQGLVQEELYQAQQLAFTDEAAKQSLPLLRLKLMQHQMEVRYIQSLLERTRIVANQDGLVILDSPDEMIGQTVQVGQRLLEVANPLKTQLEIQLPVADDVGFNLGDEIVFFQAANPDEAIRGKLISIDSQAQLDQGQFAFRMLAQFSDTAKLRIGQRGTARILSQKVSLGYYLFRRPIAFLRQQLGF